MDPRSRTDLGAFRGFVSSGAMVLFYDRMSDELSSLTATKLADRLYVIYKYQYVGSTIRISLKKQTCAMSISQMGNDIPKHSFSTFDELKFYVTGSELLQHGLLEGLDFKLSIDGTLERIQP